MSLADDPYVQSDASDESDDQHHGDAAASGARRIRSSRACVACRRMKTRCEIDEALGDACKLCIRARRPCIMQTVTRRRRPKTTDRVADLEKKIDALTALLASSQAATSGGQASGASGATEVAEPSQNHESDPDQTLNPMDGLIVNALNQGLLDWDTACRAFSRYQHEMCQFFPFVVFPPSSNADYVRNQQPFLFFTIVTLALFSTHSSTAADLVNMLTKDLALRIVHRGERSLELVQALLLYTTYYAKPKPTRELNFNQIVHMASTMALDIGLGRRSHKTSRTGQASRNELESLAGRRAWLGCYYLATSASTSLRHPSFVRWSAYIEECLDVLASEPQALPSDTWLCDLVRLQHIVEDAAVMFSMDDPGSTVTLNDPKTRYQMGVFRQQLEHWRRSCKTSRLLPYVRHIEASATLYVHEIALHSEHNIDEFRPPLRPMGAGPTRENLIPSMTALQVLPARIESLFACLSAIHGCFDALLSMNLTTLCALPNMFFVRTGYAAWALRKLLNVCESQPFAEGQFTINTEDLKFEEYLSALIETLARVCEQNNSHVVRAFYVVMTQIKAQASKSSDATNRADISTRDVQQILQTGCVDGSQSGSAPTKVSDSASQRSCPAENTNFRASNNEPIISPQQLQLDAYLQSDQQLGVPSLVQANMDDSAMTGIEALQWFDQDFAFDDLQPYRF
ncbi:hypothetical protein HRR78_008512 [Exophiala dermatitidis]|nr:hypothetical protein HRR78_008512 [Exophiala dermatitidis]